MFRKFDLKTKFSSVFIVIVLIMILATVGLVNTISPIKSEWETYQNDIALRQTLLMEIKSSLGYGGTIHNFKNYVLRGTEKYEQRLAKNFAQLNELLTRYRNLPVLSDQEKDALTNLAQVVNQYQIKQVIIPGVIAS